MSIANSGQQNIDLSSLSTADKAELSQFMENEASKVRVQSAIHSLTDVCFKKCISRINSGTLDGKEEACTNNCVDRFIDSSESVLRHLSNLRQAG